MSKKEVHTDQSGSLEVPIKQVGIGEITLAMGKASLPAIDKSLDDFLMVDCKELFTKSSAIYESREYKVFGLLNGNRHLNESHVVALMKSFQNDGYLFTILYVNEKMRIIDGQHRFEAARRLKLPIRFIIVPGWGIEQVSILNVQSKNWTAEDFMNTHVSNGNQDYARFKQFFDTYKFDITTCQIILLGKRLKQTKESDPFRAGAMKCSAKDLAKGHEWAKMILDFKDFHPKGYFRRSFIDAMLRLFNVSGYNHKYMLAKFTKKPELALKNADSLRREEYLSMFLEKYNFRSKKKIKLK